MSRMNGWNDHTTAKFKAILQSNLGVAPLKGEPVEVRIMPHNFRSVRVIYKGRSTDVEGPKGYMWWHHLASFARTAAIRLVRDQPTLGDSNA